MRVNFTRGIGGTGHRCERRRACGLDRGFRDRAGSCVSAGARRTAVRAARASRRCRSAGDVSSEEARPAASGRLEYAIDERVFRRRRSSAPKNERFGPPADDVAFNVVATCSRRVPARGAQCSYARARARARQ